MSDVLILPRIHVMHANAMQVPWLISMSVAMPACMMVHALSRRLNITTGGVAILHHDGYYLGSEQGGKFYPSQRSGASSNVDRRGDYAGDTLMLADQPVAEMGITVTLFIELDDPDIALDEVSDFLRGGRLAGGDIIRFGRPVVKRIGSVRSHPGKGYWLTDDKQMMRHYANDPVALATEISRYSDTRWRTAGVAGYLFLESPTARAGTRQNLPHCFAEALVAPMKYQLAHKETLPPFWRYHEDQSGIRLLNDELILPSQGIIND